MVGKNLTLKICAYYLKRKKKYKKTKNNLNNKIKTRFLLSGPQHKNNKSLACFFDKKKACLSGAPNFMENMPIFYTFPAGHSWTVRLGQRCHPCRTKFDSFEYITFQSVDSF